MIKLRRDITFDTPVRESRKRTNRRKIRKGRQSNIDGIVDNLPVSNIISPYNKMSNDNVIFKSIKNKVLTILHFLQDYVGSGDYDTDDEDYEYIDYEDEDYGQVNVPDRVEPVIDNGVDTNGKIDFDENSEGLSDLVIRITLKMEAPWNNALGMFSLKYIEYSTMIFNNVFLI